MSSRSVKIAIGLFLLIFIVSSYLLVDHQFNQQLWGHLPLFQFSSFWLSLVFFIKRKSFQDKEFLQRIGLLTLTSILLSIGFPPFPFPFLLFVAFVPLLLVIKPFEEAKSIRSGELFFYLYHAFFLWNVFTTYWVVNTAYFAGLFANSVNAFLMTLPILLYIYIVQNLGPRVGLMAFLTTWVTFEFLHMHWELYWPWLTLGNGLAKMNYGIQWYEITGALGGSAWILVINYLVYSWLKKYRENSSLKPLFTPALLFFSPLLTSIYIYFNYSEQGDTIEVVSVQPNFEPHYEKFAFPQEEMVGRMLSLAKEKITSQTDFVVLPETSLSRVNLDAPWQSGTMRDLAAFATNNNLNVVAGLAAIRFLNDPEEIKLSTTIPLNRQDGKTEYVEQYNCAVQIDPGQNIQEYYKALYVPGAEFFPYKKILFFLQPIVDALGGTNYGYRIRTKFALFTSNAAVVAPPICYESIFGEFITRFVQKGAEVIFVMTNDGWWDNTAGHRQHADYARLRSIETRRDVVRSANMGTCCIINQRGDISNKTIYGEPNAINVEAHKNTAITFYVKWGDFIGRISLFISLLFLARSSLKKYRA